MIYNVGKHKVRHGNVYETDSIRGFVGGNTADIFYSDPPWGTGNLKYWDTLNKKMNKGEDTPGFGFDVDNFLLVVLGSAIEFTKGFIVIEYGKRWTSKLITIATSLGLIHCNTIEALYNKVLPLDIVVFHTNKYVAVDLSLAYHTTGYRCVKTMFSILKPPSGGVGMDLCCGMGYTAQACVDNNMTFIGNELNKTRLMKAIKRLEKDKTK